MDHLYKDKADSLPPIDHADFYGVRSHRYESESLVSHGCSPLGQLEVPEQTVGMIQGCGRVLNMTRGLLEE
jgi:hypothetical protein